MGPGVRAWLACARARNREARRTTMPWLVSPTAMAFVSYPKDLALYSSRPSICATARAERGSEFSQCGAVPPIPGPRGAQLCRRSLH